MTARPNAPNSPAWTATLGTYTPPPRKAPKPGTRAYTVSLWTAPLTVALTQKGQKR